MGLAISHAQARQAAWAGITTTILAYIDQQDAASRRNVKTKYFAGDLWRSADGVVTRKIIAISSDRRSVTWEGPFRRNQHDKRARYGRFTIAMTSWCDWVVTCRAERADLFVEEMA